MKQMEMMYSGLRVDRTRKIPVTTLLRALGIVTDEQIT